MLGVDGTVIWASHNHPGSFNDAYMATPLFEALVDPVLTHTDCYLLADSAFPCNDLMFRKIITPLTATGHRILSEGDPEMYYRAAERSRVVTALRQACEWGVAAPFRAFPRITALHPLPTRRRGTRILNTLRLFNFRVRNIWHFGSSNRVFW